MGRKKLSEDKPRQQAHGPKALEPVAGAGKPRSEKPSQRKKPLRKPAPSRIASDEPDITLPLLSVETEAEGQAASDAPIGMIEEISLEEEPGASEETEDARNIGRDIEQSSGGSVAGDEPEQVPVSVMELLSFDLGDVRYAFRLEDVEEIVRSRSITRVPGVKPFVIGITSIRGKVIPVVDIAGFFKESSGHGGNGHGKIIVLGSLRGPVGVLVGKRINIISVMVGALAEPPSHMTEEARAIIAGVAQHHGRFVSVINAGHMLGIPAIGGLHEREA